VTTATIPKTLHELRNYDGPIWLANRTNKKITCRQKFGNDQVDFELEPEGDEQSIVLIPKLALDVRGIQKLLMTGELEVSIDPSMEQKVELLMNQHAQTPEDRLRQIAEFSGEGTTLTMDNPNSKSMVEKACLECGAYDPKTGALMRGRVFQTVQEVKDGIPPLCSVHKHLQSQYVSRVVSDGQGNQRYEFDKVTVG